MSNKTYPTTKNLAVTHKNILSIVLEVIVIGGKSCMCDFLLFV